MNQEETLLVVRTLAGDEAAFAELVTSYLSPLYNFVFLIVRDREVADDIVQESFIKAWRSLKRFDTKQSFKTWIFTIAKNTAFDVLKKKKALPFSSFENEEGELPFEGEMAELPTVCDTLEQEELARILEGVLETLPTHYRALMALVYQEDYRLHEAAEILGIPYNTAKSQHQRAIRRIRAAYVPQAAPAGDTHP